MNAVAHKISTLLPKFEERGAVYLFALFERDDVAGKWDVVFSSEWSDKDAASAVRTISEQVVPLLKGNELAALSRIVVVPSTEPSVQALAFGMSVAGGCAEIVNCNFMGLEIKHGFLFKSQRPPISQPANSPA